MKAAVLEFLTPRVPETGRLKPYVRQRVIRRPLAGHLSGYMVDKSLKEECLQHTDVLLGSVCFRFIMLQVVI